MRGLKIIPALRLGSVGIKVNDGRIAAQETQGIRGGNPKTFDLSGGRMIYGKLILISGFPRFKGGIRGVGSNTGFFIKGHGISHVIPDTLTSLRP